jgi:hypothetical protein
LCLLKHIIALALFRLVHYRLQFEFQIVFGSVALAIPTNRSSPSSHTLIVWSFCNLSRTLNRSENKESRTSAVRPRLLSFRGLYASIHLARSFVLVQASSTFFRHQFAVIMRLHLQLRCRRNLHYIQPENYSNFELCSYHSNRRIISISYRIRSGFK